MGIFDKLGNLIAGKVDRRKGESATSFNSRAHSTYKNASISAKKASGQWLPKAEYEAKTGRRGRSG